MDEQDIPVMTAAKIVHLLRSKDFSLKPIKIINQPVTSSILNFTFEKFYKTTNIFLLEWKQTKQLNENMIQYRIGIERIHKCEL